jgi:hypothetical protein
MPGGDLIWQHFGWSRGSRSSLWRPPVPRRYGVGEDEFAPCYARSSIRSNGRLRPRMTVPEIARDDRLPIRGSIWPGPARLILPRLPPAWAHVIRVVLGVWIALYLSYFLQLDSPYWAATTVLLAANPIRGRFSPKANGGFSGPSSAPPPR